MAPIFENPDAVAFFQVDHIVIAHQRSDSDAAFPEAYTTGHIDAEDGKGGAGQTGFQFIGAEDQFKTKFFAAAGSINFTGIKMQPAVAAKPSSRGFGQFQGSAGQHCEAKLVTQLNGQLPFNDAPNLVPELSPTLVNRRSHFLIADDERGHLLGIQGELAGDWTLHIERADARTGDEADPLRYRLNFLEIASPPLEKTRVNVFIAEGRDDLEGLDQHRTIGAGVERSLDDRNSISAEIEAQAVEHPFDDEVRQDFLASVGFSRAGLGSISVVMEQSDDPEMTDDPLTPEIETERRTWLGLLVRAPLDRYHEVTVFAGKRRGGTACTSGTCYLVPDFSGVELRMTSRF